MMLNFYNPPRLAVVQAAIKAGGQISNSWTTRTK